MSIQLLFMPCVAVNIISLTAENRKPTHLGQPQLILILHLDKLGPFAIPKVSDRRRARCNFRAAHNGHKIRVSLMVGGECQRKKKKGEHVNNKSCAMP